MHRLFGRLQLIVMVWALALLALATPAFAQTTADLAIAKQGPAEVVSGNVTYSIRPRNNGPNASINPTVTDQIPAGMTFVSLSAPAGWTCTTPAVGANGTVTCSKPSMLPGETALLTLTVNITTAIQGQFYTNTASIDSTAPGETDPVPGNDSSSTTVEVVDSGSFDLQIVKSHSGGALLPGDSVVFSLHVSNVGITPVPAIFPITVTDTLPAGLTATAISGSGWACTLATLSCTRAAALVPPGTALPVINLTATVSPSASPGMLTNQAQVFLPGGDADAANDIAQDQVLVVLSADLAVTKTGTAAVLTGGSITYNIGLSNLGPSNAPNASLSDPLPAGTTFVSLASPPGWTCTTPAVGANGTVTCNTASFAAGSSTGFLLVVQAPATAGTVVNTATVASGASDPNAANNTASATTTVTAAPLTPTETTLTSAPNPSTFGEAVAFTAVVTEIIIGGGGDAASPPEAPPAGTVTFQEGATVLGTAPLVGNTAVLTISTLSIGSHTVTAVYGGDVTHSGSTSNPVIQVVLGGSLSLAIGFSQPNYSAAGEIFNVLYTVTNTSQVTINGIAVTDPKVPEITCPQTSLAPAASMVCSGPYTVTAADMTAGITTFTATVTGSGGATATATGSISAAVIVILNDDFVRTRGQLLQIDPPGIHDRIGQVTANLTESNGDPTLSFAASYVGGASSAADDLVSGAVVLPYKVWIDGKLTLHTRDNGGGGFGQLGLGGDYLVNENILLGAALYIDWMTDKKTGRTTTGVGYLAGPYVSAKIAEHLTFDGGIFFGGSTNDVSVMAAGRPFNGTYHTQRIVVQAQLDGLWNLDALTIRPDATLFLRHETVGGYTVRDAQGTVVPVSGFVNTSLNLSGGTVFEKAITLESGLVVIPQAGFRVGVTGKSDALELNNPYGSVSAGYILEGEHWQYRSTVEWALWASSLKAATWRGTLAGEF